MGERFDRARMEIIRDRDHTEALKEYAARLRVDIATMLGRAGFEIEYDRYGDQGVVLRHVYSGPYGHQIDVEIPLDC